MQHQASKDVAIGEAASETSKAGAPFVEILRSHNLAKKLCQDLRREVDEFRAILAAVRAESQRGDEISSSGDRIAASLSARIPGLFSGRSLRQSPLHHSSTPRDSATLSAREQDVLRLTADGQSRKEMAFALGISEKTVAFHKGNLKRKLGLQTTADLVRYVLQKAG